MGEAHVEMGMIHAGFKANGRADSAKAELKTRFLEANPRAEASDYHDWMVDNPDMYKSSLELHMSRFDDVLQRGEDEEKLSRVAAKTDRAELDLSGDSRKLFADRSERIAYDNLNECFSNDVLSAPGPDNFWKFETRDMVAFGDLLADARAGIQRNAAELHIELATAMSTNEQALRGTELFDALEELKRELHTWDSLLATAASPDKIKMREQAKKCADALEYSRKLHGQLLAKGETNPFVKYQLLATMAALGEKVASQYAARAGKASFSGLCEIVRDVPNRGSKGKEKAKKLKLGADDPGKGFAHELSELQTDLAKIDKTTADEMKTKLTKASYGVLEALKTWHDNYRDLKKLKTNLEALRVAAAKIAFGVKQYKAIADSVLGNENKFKAIGDRYQETFDAVTGQLQNDIEKGLDMFGSGR